MKKILIATRNRDKFQIVKRLFETSIFEEYQFDNLNDLNINVNDKVESGSLESRSFEKAANSYVNIQENEYEYIVGIDDGIKIKGIIYEDVKKLVNLILNHGLLSDGEIIYMVRAYTFFNQKGESYTITIDIPYRYQRLNYELTVEENTYPLNYVLAPINSDKTIAEQDFEESNQYFLSYSYDKFHEVKSFFEASKKKK